MKRLLFIIAWLAFAIALTLVHRAVLSTVPPLWQGINIIGFFTILILLIGSLERAMIVAAASGYLLDMTSTYPFGIFLGMFLSLIAVLILWDRYVLGNGTLHGMVIMLSVGTLWLHLFWNIVVLFTPLFDATAVQWNPSMMIRQALLQLSLHTIVGGLLLAGIHRIRPNLFHAHP